MIALQLKQGTIGTIIKARKINLLRCLLSANENDMTYKVFITQWNHLVKQDWVLPVRKELRDFKIEPNLSNLKKKLYQLLQEICESESL